VHSSDHVAVLTLIGDVLAATAVTVAAVQLVRSRRELVRERRRQFYLEHLVELSRTLTAFGSGIPEEARVQVRLLPQKYVPSAHEWAQSGAPRSGVNGHVYADYERERDGAEPPLVWNEWIRDRVRTEIDNAIGELLESSHTRGPGGVDLQSCDTLPIWIRWNSFPVTVGILGAVFGYRAGGSWRIVAVVCVVALAGLVVVATRWERKHKRSKV
jgi:hypothetical protein